MAGIYLSASDAVPSNERVGFQPQYELGSNGNEKAQNKQEMRTCERAEVPC